MYKNLEIKYLPKDSPFHRKSLKTSKTSGKQISFRESDLKMAYISKKRKWIDWQFVAFYQKTTNWDALVNIAQPSLVETDCWFSWEKLTPWITLLDNIIVENTAWRQRKISVVLWCTDKNKSLANTINLRVNALIKKIISHSTKFSWSQDSQELFDLSKYFRFQDFEKNWLWDDFVNTFILELRKKLGCYWLFVNLVWTKLEIKNVWIHEYFPDIDVILDCIAPKNWILSHKFSILASWVWVLEIGYKHNKKKPNSIRILSTWYDSDECLSIIWDFVAGLDLDVTC